MNFTDNPSQYQFAPLVDTLATDSLIKTELERQRQFDIGVQKIQSFVDQDLNLPIAKAETQEYVRGKLSQLKQHLSTSITGDFSDMRLINQVGGLTSRIANDPIVAEGVRSTLAIQAGKKQMEEDVKAGKINPYNQQDFSDAVQQYLSDGRNDTAFEGAYVSPVDYTAKFTKLWNEKSSHANSQLTQDDVRINTATGTIGVINQREHEGVSPAEINSLWQQVMSDPSVQQQLAIESRQHFKGVDGQEFSQYLHDSYQESLSSINSKIKEIQDDASLKKSANPLIATQYVEQLKNQGTILLNQYKQIGHMLEQGDIEGAKHAVYVNNLSSMFMSNYTWSKDKDEVKDSPLFSAQMKQAEYELNQDKFDYQKQHDRDELAYKYTALVTDGKTKPGTAGDGTETVTHGGLTPQEAGEKTRSTFYEDLEQKQNALTQSRMQWVFNSMDKDDKSFNPIRINPSTQQYEYNIDRTGISGYKSPRGASEAYISRYKDLRKLMDEGNLKRDDLVDFYSHTILPSYHIVQQQTEVAKNKEAQFAPQLKDITKQIGNNNVSVTYFSPSVNKDVKLNVTTDDFVNVWMAENNQPGKEDAQKALESKFGKEAARYLRVNSGVRTTNGEYEKTYNRIAGIIKQNKGIPALLQQREEAFKNAQSSFNPTETAILPKTKGEEDNWVRKFSDVASMYKPSGSDNGPADDFISLLNGEDKNGIKTYAILHDQNSGQWSLRVTQDKKTQTLPVDKKFIDDWGFKTQNDFWDQYGPSLSLKNNTTTDVNGTGESGAFHMKRDRGSKYDIRYHLEGDGHSNFFIKLWVRDKATGKLLLGDHNIGEVGTPDKVMNMLNDPQFLKSDLMIDGLLAKYK